MIEEITLIMNSINVLNVFSSVGLLFQLLAKRSSAALPAVNVAAKMLYLLYITNKTEHFSFKSGCVMQVMEHLNFRVAVLIAVVF